MNHRQSMATLCWLALLFVSVSGQSPRSPNIIFIFADDLGYADLGVYGSTKNRTPNLDRMAAEGMRFTDFYSSSPLCTPSRASLMTGCYAQRVSLQVNEKDQGVLFPVNQRGLNAGETTLPELLKTRGYATSIIGKWHLGDQPEFLPTRHGFDEYFGIPYSNDMGNERPPNTPVYPPLPLLRNEKVIEIEPDQRALTRHYTDEAIRFIKAQRGKPFFLYLPHSMPHWPQYASENFAGKSANGKWGDAVEELDWSVGELMKTLKELKLDNNTLVFFTSDNGGQIRDGANNAPLRGGKATTLEGGLRVPMIARWPGKIPAGRVNRELATMMDVLPTLTKLTGAQLPKDRVIDGRDIQPLLTGKRGARSPHEFFFYYRLKQLQAVRSGQWKLQLAREEMVNRQPTQVPLALYDLTTDIGETRDVAAAHPDIVQRLRVAAERMRAELGDGATMGNAARPAGHVEKPQPLTLQTTPK